MAARDADVPRYAYPLAIVGGLCFSWFSFLVAAIVTQVFDSWERGLGFLGTVVFAASHVLVGGLFGMLWPERTWRWGVWLCLVPMCLAALTEADVTIFLWVVMLTLAPACAGAYAAARVHLKYVDVE